MNTGCIGDNFTRNTFLSTFLLILLHVIKIKKLTFHSGYSCERSFPGSTCEPGNTNRHPLVSVTVCMAVHVPTILSAGLKAK